MVRVSRAVRLALAGAGLQAIVLLVPSPAASQGNIQVGPFRILPSLELKGEYNDNILLAPRDETSDFIWTISPGIAVELPARRSSLRLAYKADILRYTDHDELDTVEHTVQVEGRTELAFGLLLRLSDEFRRTQSFPGFPVPELTEVVDRNENTLKAGALYRVAERISLEFEYGWYMIDYDGAAKFDQFDHDEHRFSLIGYYRVMPKTAVLGELRYELVRYDLDEVARDRDSDGWAFLLGLKGDLTAKTSLVVKAGYQFKDYDNPTREDFDGFIAEAEAIWKYAEPSQFRLYVGRANIESTFVGTNYYVTTYGGAELRHYITPVLVLKVTGLVGNNDYPEPRTVGTAQKERSDDFFSVGVGIQYQIRRWLAVSLDYAYLDRSSNIDEFEYTNNRIWATVKMTY